MLLWRNDTLFYFLIFLFIWASFWFDILMILQWFETKERFGFSYQLLLKLSRVRGKRNKKDFWTIFVIFKFWNISKCANRSWHQIKQMFLISYQCFWSVSLLLKFGDTVKQIWRNVTMPLHQTFCLTFIYGCIKFGCPNGRESWVIEACKSPISRCKTWYSLENGFNS